MPTLESQTEFARRHGVAKSTVTRWRAAGRLVVSEDGRVDVDASQRRLGATTGRRLDLADRWQGYREAKGNADPAPSAPAPESPPEEAADATLELDEVGRRTRIAQMRKEEAIARQKEREDQELAGVLVRKAAVRCDLTDAAAIILSTWEALPDRLAPILVNIDDQTRIRAILRDEVEQLAQQVSEQLEAAARGRSP